MRTHIRLLASALALGLPACVAAQQNVTIQLPTFNMTTVQTTVSVPDGGYGVLGGVSRAAEGSSSRGVPLLSGIPGLNRLFNNRGIGRELSDWSMTVHPRIIDLQEEELRQTGVSADSLTLGRDALPPSGFRPSAAAGRSLAAVDPQVAGQAAFLAANIARNAPAAATTAPQPPSLAAIRQGNERARVERAAEAEEFWAKGQQAESAGKAGVAKIYYQMAVSRAEGDLKDRVAARLVELAEPSMGPRIAGR